jgi:cobalamin biosynthesis Mg chelatase CobN
MKRITLAIAAAGLLLAPLTSEVAAQQPDTKDRTIMTFSGAVELPGMRLEPGKYVFRLADTATRNVVQVLSEDESKVLGQWLFVSAERQEASDETVVTFRERSATATPAVQYWYYPGERIGKEFIYPKDQALRIAARTGATVRTEEGPVSAPGQTAAATSPVGPAEASAQTASAAPSRMPQTEGNTASAQQRTDTASTQQRASTVDQAQADRDATTVRQDTADTSRVRQEGTFAQNDTARTELPATASPYPLMGLIAALALAGAAGIRAFRL